MHRIILASALLLFSFVSFGQDNEKKAKQILNKVSKQYKSLKTLKANFDMEITEPGSTRPSTEKGLLYLRGNSFKLELSTIDIICDGKIQWYVMKDVNEVQISTYDPSGQEISPSTIFTLYEKGFKSIWVSEGTEQGKTVDNIELVPKNNQEKKEYTKIKLTIDREANQIIRSEILFRSGRKMKYTINQQVRNLNLANDFFSFDPSKKAGMVVVDLR